LPKNPGSTLAVIQYLRGTPMMILMIWRNCWGGHPARWPETDSDKICRHSGTCMGTYFQ